MQAYEVIQRLKETSGTKDKEEIIREAWEAGCLEFFLGARLAYDNQIVFGVKKVVMYDLDGSETKQELFESPTAFSWNDFVDLSKKLETRELTGNAARDALADAAGKTPMWVWNNWYRAILVKDLGCGVTEKTINKVLKPIKEAKDYLIPEFVVHLASPGDEMLDKGKITGERYVDVKLDGYRMVALLDKRDNSVTLLSRQGKPFENFTHIEAGLSKLLEQLPGSVVLDGEVVSASFQELMTQARRKTNPDASDAKYALFDIIPLADFMSGQCDQTQRKRHEVLSSMAGMFQEHCGDSVYVVPKLLIDLDTEEGMDRLMEFNQQALEAEFEGVMIKDPEAPYKRKRTKGWLKIKPFIDVDLEIVGYYEGEPDGKRAGLLGGFTCEGEHDGKEVRVDVGGGFTDKQIKEFWEQRDEMIGWIIEVRADCLTLERDSTVYSMRFPRFRRLRGHSPGEKV